MSRRSRHAIVFAVLSPLALFAACGGDDVVLNLPDAGQDSTAPRDGSSGDSMTPVDAPRDTFVAEASGARDGGVDAARDAQADVAADSNVPPDTGIDAPVIIFDSSVDVQVFDGGMCNNLVNGGSAIPETNVAADPPVGQGGTIQPGLYYLTKWEQYTGADGGAGTTGNTRKTAFYFYATQYLKVTADNGAGDENDTRDWNVDATDATLLDSNQFCPTANNLSSYFTADNTGKLVLIGGTAASEPVEVTTFQHQ